MKQNVCVRAESNAVHDRVVIVSKDAVFPGPNPLPGVGPTGGPLSISAFSPPQNETANRMNTANPNRAHETH